MIPRKRICIVCSAPGTFEAFLAPIVHRLSSEYDVTVAMNGRAAQPEVHSAEFRLVGLERKVMPLLDCRALLQLIRLFSKEEFDLVHSFTPKAGLLAMLAARLTGVPCRLHTFTGQVWATRNGVTRWLLKVMDRILALCATEVLADSPSQLAFLVQEEIVPPGAGRILGAGSVCGVNLDRFRADPVVRKTVRRELGLDDSSVVYLFIGRMNTDKGLLDLARAFGELARSHSDTYLVLVGPDEEGLGPKIREILSGLQDQLRLVAPTPYPEKYMQAVDVLCLPSYREGFGTVIIEAAACGLPCIASKIYGVTDAVEENVTGLLHPPKDTEQILACMQRLRAEPALREEMGHAARERVARLFSQPAVINALIEFYRARLST